MAIQRAILWLILLTRFVLVVAYPASGPLVTTVRQGIGRQWRSTPVATETVFLPLVLQASVPLPWTEPSPAFLIIGGEEQISGIGNYCWKDLGTGLPRCVDIFVIRTTQEPLLAHSPFTAYFRLAIQEPPDSLSLIVFRVTERDEVKSEDEWRWWRLEKEGELYLLPGRIEPDIELSLMPGLYVLNLFASWQQFGDVEYGFLVEVRSQTFLPLIRGRRMSGSEPPCVLCAHVLKL